MKPIKYLTRLFISSLIIICFQAAAQTANKAQKAAVARSDSADTKLSIHLGISRARAKKLRAAYNYKSDEIKKLAKDSTMKPRMRSEKIQNLLAERQQQIDAVMTPGLKDTLKARMGDPESKMAQHLKIQTALQETRLNKVPHHTHMGISTRDSIRKNSNTKPKTKLD
jgi:hypothetical protein